MTVSTMMQFLPELLSILLDQSQGESLERLQLCEINLLLLKPAPFQGNSCLINQQVIRSGERDKFLSLSGRLADSSGAWLLMEINYFIRGEKKYFRAETNLIGSAQPWREFCEQDISNFFSSLNQENSFFTSHDLAILNGRTEVQVPSQLLMLETWHAMLKQWPNTHKPLSSIKAKFLASVKLGEPLSIASKLSDSTIESMIFSAQGPVLEINASSLNH